MPRVGVLLIFIFDILLALYVLRVFVVIFFCFLVVLLGVISGLSW